MITFACFAVLTIAWCWWWMWRVTERCEKRLADEYLHGFRDGVAYEAKANRDSAGPRVVVRVPLTGVN